MGRVRARTLPALMACVLAASLVVVPAQAEEDADAGPRGPVALAAWAVLHDDVAVESARSRVAEAAFYRAAAAFALSASFLAAGVAALLARKERT